MNIYMVYSADFYDRSVGTVILHEKQFTDEEFEKIVRGAMIQQDYEKTESEIVDYLIENCGFVRASVVKCNTEYT